MGTAPARARHKTLHSESSDEAVGTRAPCAVLRSRMKELLHSLMGSSGSAGGLNEAQSAAAIDALSHEGSLPMLVHVEKVSFTPAAQKVLLSSGSVSKIVLLCSSPTNYVIALFVRAANKPAATPGRVFHLCKKGDEPASQRQSPGQGLASTMDQKAVSKFGSEHAGSWS